MDIASLFDSGLTGGLFGLFGNLAGKVVGIFESREAFTQKKEEWGHDERLADLQMKAKVAETDQALAVTASSGSWSGLGDSLKAEGAIGATYAWVNAVRALVRPALTMSLGGFLAAAFFATTGAVRDQISDSLVFAAVTAIVWWLGDRSPKRA